MMGSGIEAFIHGLNASWQQADWSALPAFYHADAVLLPPDGGTPIVGRAAIVDTYREFFTMARLHSFTVESIESFDFGSCVACHMSFSVDYSLLGKNGEDERMQDRGLEVYLINHNDAGEYQICWRQQTTT